MSRRHYPPSNMNSLWDISHRSIVLNLNIPDDQGSKSFVGLLLYKSTLIRMLNFIQHELMLGWNLTFEFNVVEWPVEWRMKLLIHCTPYDACNYFKCSSIFGNILMHDTVYFSCTRNCVHHVCCQCETQIIAKLHPAAKLMPVPPTELLSKVQRNRMSLMLWLMNLHGDRCGNVNSISNELFEKYLMAFSRTTPP